MKHLYHNDLISQVAKMIAARLQSNDPITRSYAIETAYLWLNELAGDCILEDSVDDAGYNAIERKEKTMHLNTTSTNRQEIANDLISQVAGMIAARLQSRDPLTQAEGYRLLTACPFAENAVHKILCENR